MNGPLTADRPAAPLLPKTTTPAHHRLFLKGERLQGPLSAKKNAGRQTAFENLLYKSHRPRCRFPVKMPINLVHTRCHRRKAEEQRRVDLAPLAAPRRRLICLKTFKLMVFGHSGHCTAQLQRPQERMCNGTWLREKRSQIVHAANSRPARSRMA